MEPQVNPWDTPMGRECASLDVSLAQWLGERLMFLATHQKSRPGVDHKLLDVTVEEWRADLAQHGTALLQWANHFDMSAAEEALAVDRVGLALSWLEEHFFYLWD